MNMNKRSGRISVSRFATNSCAGIWVAVALVVQSWYMIPIAIVGQYVLGKTLSTWVQKGLDDLIQ